MKVYEQVSRKETKRMTTEEMREAFLMETIFTNDEIVYNYSHYDRVIVGGAKPVNKTLSFDLAKELGVNFFLERREIGFINIGGAGSIKVDGTNYKLLNKDGIYVGVGNKKIEVSSKDIKNPMKLFFMSTPGRKEFPTVVVENAKAKPVELGEDETLNKRTIFQYFHPDVCKTNQLLMGMTVLAERNVWNTMPTHTHDRRMEAYFYFDMEKQNRVFHIHGEPNQTRHIIMKNEQGVLSPSWSIHGGAGTGPYTFIWAMAGENQTFTDMQHVAMEDLK